MEYIDKKFNQKIFTMGLGGAITGLVVALLGIGLCLARVRLAVGFLGAKTLFGMAFAQEDAIKISIVLLVGVCIFLSGFGLFAAGTLTSLIEYGRKKQ